MKPNADHKVFYQGKWWLVPDLAKRCGMSYATLYKRIFRYGWSVRKAVLTPVNKSKAQHTGRSKHTYKYLGKEWALKELAEHFGIAYSTLHRRIVIQGWSVTRAVNTPVDKNKSRMSHESHNNSSRQRSADTQ